MRDDLRNRLRYAEEQQAKSIKLVGYWLMIVGFAYLIAALLFFTLPMLTLGWDFAWLSFWFAVAAAAGAVAGFARHRILNHEINQALSQAVAEGQQD
ncbi:hypothetical protein ACTXLI_16115 [Glutamicibacter arilaitensis]